MKPDPILNRVRRDALPDDFKPIWDSALATAGETAYVEVFANNPDVLRWYQDCFYGRLFNSPGSRLDDRTKELIRLRLSKGHGCHVCNSFNVGTARAAGLSDAQIDAVVAADPALFDERDRAVIELAAQIDMGNLAGHISPSLHRRLRGHYDDGQLVEMGMIAAMLMAMAKFLFVFDLVTREEACPIAPREPVEA